MNTSKPRIANNTWIPDIINLRERAQQRADEQAEYTDTESDEEGEDPLFHSDKDDLRNATYNDIRNNGTVSNLTIHM